MKYAHILNEVLGKPWAITPEKLNAILAFMYRAASGVEISAEDRAAMRAAQRPTVVNAGRGVAVLPLFGSIFHRANMIMDFSGGTSTEVFAKQFRAALADPNVTAILVDVDSPGGSVDGVQELAAEIYASRGKKPVVAVANSLAASAAYWIASAADETVVSPSAFVGSIGVYMAHEDFSKMLDADGVKVTLISAGAYKTEGNAYEPLTDEGKTYYQGLVNEVYGRFVGAVALHRGVSADVVLSSYGQGRLVSAPEAVTLGMADRVATFEQTLAQLGARGAESVAQAEAPGTPQLSIAKRKLQIIDSE